MEDLFKRLALQDIPQQELVSSYDSIKRKYDTLLIEFIQLVLEYHFDDCDLLRVDFFNDIKANFQNNQNNNTLKSLTLLTKDGRDVRHIEHDVEPTLVEWLSKLSQKKKGESEIAAMENLTVLMSNLIKFSFIYMTDKGIKETLDTLLFIVEDEGRILACSLGFVDSILRYGVVSESFLSPLTKIIFAGFCDEGLVNQAESITRNVMVSPCAMMFMHQVFASLNEDLELGALQLLLFVVKEREYPLKCVGLMLQCVTGISNNHQLARPSLQLCLEIVLHDNLDINDLSEVARIWCECALIAADMKIDWDKQDNDFYYHSKLLKHFIDCASHPSMPSQSLLKILSVLIANPSLISKPIALFMINCLSNHFLWADTFSYLVVFDSAFLVLYNNFGGETDIKLELLASSFSIIESQMFHYSSSQLLETFTRKVIHLLAFEKDPKVLDVLESWLKKSIHNMSQSDVLLCFEMLLQACCGVRTTSESDSLIGFWERFVSKNTKVQNIPHPATKSPGYTRREVEEYQSVFATRGLIHLLHQLVQIENILSDEVFYWLCHISSWSAVVPPSSRLLALNFVSTLSAKSDRYKPCYVYDGHEYFISNATISTGLVDSETRLFNLDHYLFAALAILEFEPSYKILCRSFEALLLSLSRNDAWISNGPKVALALRLLCDKVVNMIMAEFNFSNLTIDVVVPLKKHELFLTLYQVLFALFRFKGVLNKQQLDILAPALLFGLGRWPPIARSIMQGLHLSLYELPRNSITRHLSAIILKISQLTSSNLALPNLEFLATLASLPLLHINFTNEDYKRIFGIALTYLRQRGGVNSTQQSVFAYYVMQVWFLGLKLPERVKFVPMIVSTLLANTDKQIEGSNESLDENVELVLDMMAQHAFVDCTPKPLVHVWSKQFGRTNNGKTWCQGNTLISIQKSDGQRYELVFRRPVGLTVIYTEIANGLGQMKFYDIRGEVLRSDVSRLESSTAARGNSESSLRENVLDSDDPSHFDPTFLILQFQPYPILSLPQEPPRLLGTDDSTIRAVSVLDRTPSIDLHKIGVIYVGPGQISESEILGNSAGSEYYTNFLLSLGQFVALANNRDIYTGGLDTSPECFDGRYAILFVPDQRLTQMIFHVTTLIPTNPHDPSSIAKKRHIGNDFVMIVWNEGGMEYDRNTIPGQFNLVQIVVEPLFSSCSQSYSSCGFRVTVWLRPDITAPTPLPVILSGVSLGSFVRQIAIYYNMIAQVFISGEASSNAKERLRQIKRLKSRMDPISAQQPLDFSSLA